MKVILIDDEYYALEGLKLELESFPHVEIVGMYEDGREALKELDQTNPDVIFLDIEMPEMDGFTLVHSLLDKNPRCRFVFVTAYHQYAVQAFEANALDYLLKPVQQHRLQKTMDRLDKRWETASKDKKIHFECFKHFSIQVDRVEINRDWRTKKSEELLAYLICEKGKFVSKDKIIDALWGDMDADKGMANLYVAYHYIKKRGAELEVDFAVESSRGKMRMDLTQTADVI